MTRLAQPVQAVSRSNSMTPPVRHAHVLSRSHNMSTTATMKARTTRRRVRAVRAESLVVRALGLGRRARRRGASCLGAGAPPVIVWGSSAASLVGSLAGSSAGSLPRVRGWCARPLPVGDLAPSARFDIYSCGVVFS